MMFTVSALTSVISYGLILVFQIILFPPSNLLFSSFYTSLPLFFHFATSEPNAILAHSLYLSSYTHIPFWKFFNKSVAFTRYQKQKTVLLEFYSLNSSSAFMAVTQLKPTCSKTHLHSSQLSFLSRSLPRHRHYAFTPLHRTQHARISCSVAPK